MSDAATLPADMTAPTSSLMKDFQTTRAGLVSAERTAEGGLAEEKNVLGQQAAYEGVKREQTKQFVSDNPFPDPHLKPWTQKPPENNPVQSFGSWASALGILAGAITKTGLASSLNASSAAMQAFRQNDLDKYNEAHQAWKDNSEIAIKQAEWETRAYQNAFQLMEKDQALGTAQLEIALNQAHNTQGLALLKKGMYNELWEMTMGMHKFALEAPGKMQELNLIATQNARLLQLNQESAKKLGVPVAQLPPDVRLQNNVKVQNESLLQKTMTPYQIEQTNLKISGMESFFNDIDDAKKLIENTAFSVGVGGKLGRPVETLGELMDVTDESTRTRIREKLAAIKMQMPKMMVNASRQPTPLQMEENEKIIGGEQIGSTIQNVVSRLDDMTERLMPNYNVLVRSVGNSGMSTAGQPGSAAAIQPPPEVGAVKDGYRFKGGDPADQSNWEKVTPGGASGTF